MGLEVESDVEWKKVEVLVLLLLLLLWGPTVSVVASVCEEEDDEARVPGAETVLVKREEGEGEAEAVDGDEKSVPEEGESRAD